MKTANLSRFSLVAGLGITKRKLCAAPGKRLLQLLGKRLLLLLQALLSFFLNLAWLFLR
jgi:hypothetical protein